MDPARLLLARLLLAQGSFNALNKICEADPAAAVEGQRLLSRLVDRTGELQRWRETCGRWGCQMDPGGFSKAQKAVQEVLEDVRDFILRNAKPPSCCAGDQHLVFQILPATKTNFCKSLGYLIKCRTKECTGIQKASALEPWCVLQGLLSCQLGWGARTG